MSGRPQRPRDGRRMMMNEMCRDAAQSLRRRPAAYASAKPRPEQTVNTLQSKRLRLHHLLQERFDGADLLWSGTVAVREPSTATRLAQRRTVRGTAVRRGDETRQRKLTGRCKPRGRAISPCTQSRSATIKPHTYAGFTPWENFRIGAPASDRDFAHSWGRCGQRGAVQDLDEHLGAL